MPTRTKQKAASKAKPKRVHISFEKEPWYAAAVIGVQDGLSAEAGQEFISNQVADGYPLRCG